MCQMLIFIDAPFKKNVPGDRVMNINCDESASGLSGLLTGLHLGSDAFIIFMQIYSLHPGLHVID